MKNLGIRIKVFILVFIVLVPMSLLQLHRIHFQYNKDIQEELKVSQDLAEAITTSFLNYLEELWTEEFGIGLLYSSTENPDVDFIREYMRRLIEKESTVLEYSILNLEGNVVISTNKELEGMSLSHRQYIKRILKGEEKVVSDLATSVINYSPILPVSRGVYEDKKLVAIVVGVVNIDKLHSSLPKIILNRESKFGLVDSSGRIVYRSGNLNIAFEERKIPDDSPAWQALKGEVIKTYRKQTMLQRISGVDETSVMGVDYPIPKIGWSCFVTISSEMIFKSHFDKAKKDMLYLIIVALSSLIISIIFSNQIVRPLLSLKSAANRIKNGDLSARTNISKTSSTKDELVATAEAFDFMAEHIEEHDHYKSLFFTTISHELKTPLNIILGTIQLFRSSPNINYNTLEKYTQIMQQNCYRLLRLINNLIDITKLDSNYLSLKLENHNIISIVEDITLSVAQYIKTRGITLVFDTNIEEKIIACDPDKIERIMLNLLSNSVKFTKPNGSINVSIHDDIDMIRIVVQDDGIGIPQDKLKNIFDRFYQVDDTLTRKTEGSGIGLSLVKGLVEAHGGSIIVNSVYGEGSEFIIILPAKQVDKKEDCIIHIPSNELNVERIRVEFSDIYS